MDGLTSLLPLFPMPCKCAMKEKTFLSDSSGISGNALRCVCSCCCQFITWYKCCSHSTEQFATFLQDVTKQIRQNEFFTMRMELYVQRFCGSAFLQIYRIRLWTTQVDFAGNLPLISGLHQAPPRCPLQATLCCGSDFLKQHLPNEVCNSASCCARGARSLFLTWGALFVLWLLWPQYLSVFSVLSQVTITRVRNHFSGPNISPELKGIWPHSDGYSK